MSDDDKGFFEQAAAFQKIWMDSISKTTQAAFSATPDSIPPETLKQMRNGIFEALAKSWEQFMRSPQFLEAVKQMMDNAVAFKKMTSDVLTKAHHEMQGAARTDIDSMLAAVRHLESRVVDRMDELSAQLTDLKARLEQIEKQKNSGRIAIKPRPKVKATRKAPKRS